MDNGVIITRVRSKETNRYILEKPGRDPELYDNFGRNIPQPIIDALGVFHAKFSESMNFELSIANQFEGPFLLTESGIGRAQILGKLAKTALIDTAVKKIGGEIRTRARHINLFKEEIERLDEDVIKYEDLEKQARKIAGIERSIQGLDLKWKKIDRVTRISGRITRIDEQITEHARKLEKLVDLPDATQIESLAIETDKVARLGVDLRRVEESIPEIEEEIQLIDTIPENASEDLESTAQALLKIQDFSKRTQAWKARYITVKDELGGVSEKLESAINKLIEIVKGEGKCPTCFAEITEESLSRISEELEGKDVEQEEASEGANAGA